GVVLLKDGKMVEGAVTQSGTRVIVRRGTSNREFDKNEVQFIGKSKDECYRFMLGQVKAGDAPGRYKLARWCMYSGMREQALAEAKAVVKLQANYTPAVELASTLEESLRLFNEDGTPKIVAAPKTTATLLTQAIEPEPDVSAEAIKAFTAHVQPVLVNLCADCHGKPNYAGAFKMACGGPVSDPSSTRFNLKAALKQVDKNEPAASPLLVKAVAAHGGMKQAALANGAAPAFRSLEAWVFAASKSGQKPPVVPVLPPPDVKLDPPKPALPPVPKPELPPVPAVPVPRFGETAPPRPSAAPKPDNAGPAVDEFDPSLFNRRR
ncbi:MAG TPA: hypothetical protein VGI99_15365, partial [Gemmataceae bacterium]